MGNPVQPIDPKYFRAFKAVDMVGSFSEAADLAAMTQANVSKHIKALEELIGNDLFVRTPKGPVITEAGEKMREYIKHFENLHADFLVDVGNTAQEVQGTVSYAMPASCLLSPHFPMLLENRRKHPKLEINLELVPTDKVFNRILDGIIDFGFVTKKIDHPRLQYIPFCKEEYVAVAAPDIDLGALSEGKILEFNYIDYPGFDVYFEYWRNHNFPDAHNTQALSLHCTGKINSIEGAILMTLGGLGIGIFPRHCIQNHIDEKTLIPFEPEGSAPLLNDIYIASLKSDQRPYRIELVISWFMDMVKTH
jgi:DNA-binding transcriptional LysR family regulator